MSEKLKHLSKSKDNQYYYDKPECSLLEYFDNPMPGSTSNIIEIEVKEFTSLCPITGQPDFATIKIIYTPDLKCVESKSFKLYIASFRNAGMFHEECVTKIAMDFIEVMDPIELIVKGEFTPRGGIPFWPTITYNRKEYAIQQ